jgi:hypothetical protein
MLKDRLQELNDRLGTEHAISAEVIQPQIGSLLMDDAKLLSRLNALETWQDTTSRLDLGQTSSLLNLTSRIEIMENQFRILNQHFAIGESPSCGQ